MGAKTKTKKPRPKEPKGPAQILPPDCPTLLSREQVAASLLIGLRVGRDAAKGGD